MRPSAAVVASADATGVGARCSHLGQAEIQNLGVPASGDKDVGRLDVAVNDAFGMRGIQRLGNLNGKRQQSLGFERLPRNEML